MMNDTMRFFFLAFLFVLLFLSEKVQGQAVSWGDQGNGTYINPCLLYTSPSPRDVEESRMPSSA